MSDQTAQEQAMPTGAASALDDGLEREPMSLAEFIELIGSFELKPYQRELVEAVERGEKLILDQVTMREPYREWKLRYEEYLTTFMRSNAEITGG